MRRLVLKKSTTTLKTILQVATVVQSGILLVVVGVLFITNTSAGKVLATAATAYTENWTASNGIYLDWFCNQDRCGGYPGYNSGAPGSANSFATEPSYGFNASDGNFYTATTWNVTGTVGASTYAETWNATDGIYYTGPNPYNNSIQANYVTGIPANSTQAEWISGSAIVGFFSVTKWQVNGTVTP